MQNKMVIGICGGSGSGKTSILKGLAKHYADLKPTVLSLDNYYLPIEQQQKDENGEVNFDLPTALDREKLVTDVTKLMQGESIEQREYTFNHLKTVNMIKTEPSSLIILEGLFVFYYKELFDLLDYSIFVDVPMTIQLKRRIERDNVARGYDKNAVLYQWNNHVLPCYETYIEPFKKEASIVVMNDRKLSEALNEVLTNLDTHPLLLSIKQELA
jgi:uridine kinase